MKNKTKNGFTLIEILAVIIILAIIALIVTPLITGTIKTSKDDLYEIQLENIKSAAKTFMVDLDLEKNATLNVTLEELKKSGFLKKDIKNPKTNEKFANCTTVNVTRNNDVYDYEVIVSEDNSCSYDSEISMILLGYNKINISKGNEYIDTGILLRNEKGKILPLDDVKIEIKKDLNGNVETINGMYKNISNLIDTTDYYKYEIIYKYTYNDKTISKNRTIEVVEDTNLECIILPTTPINENGWITEERKAKILSINTDKNVQYSISEYNEKEYGSNQIYEIPNDGIITLYGYIKDEYGNEVSCSNTLKYEVGNPSCSINLTGTVGTNDWYTSNVTATLSITPISKITGKDITYSDVKSYNNNVSKNVSSTTDIYGYIKDEAGKEISCTKKIQIDKFSPKILDLSGTSTVFSNSVTTKLTLTAVASDTASGIYDYKFYKVSGSTETYLGNVVTTSETATYSVTNPVQGDDYKIIVTDKAGNEETEVLEANCVTTSGVCSGGSKTITVKCDTGYKYTYTLTSGCNTTTPNCSISCPEGQYQCGCQECCTNPSGGTSSTTTTTTIVDDATFDAGAEADDETLPEDW